MMFHARREAFDEWMIGRYRIQFFEPRLWRVGWPKYDRTIYPGGWAIATPMFSISRR